MIYDQICLHQLTTSGNPPYFSRYDEIILLWNYDHLNAANVGFPPPMHTHTPICYALLIKGNGLGIYCNHICFLYSRVKMVPKYRELSVCFWMSYNLLRFYQNKLCLTYCWYCFITNTYDNIIDQITWWVFRFMLQTSHKEQTQSSLFKDTAAPCKI